jgi:Right handed beta helix region
LIRRAFTLAACVAALAACGDGGNEAIPLKTQPPPRPAPPGTFYVSMSGSDRGPGSGERPWRTIQHALDVLRPGETALVRGGSYEESLVVKRAGNRSAYITLRAYPGETAVIRPAGDGPMDYPLRISTGAAYFRFAGFVVEGAPSEDTVNVYVAAQEGPYPHDIAISGCVIQNGAGSGLLVEPKAERVMVTGNVVRDNGDGTEQHHGIYYQGRSGVIANNVVYGHLNGFGIQLRAGAADVLVANNTAVHNSLSGIVVENTATDVLVVNNVSAFNGGWAVRGYDSGDGPVLPGNAAHHNLGFGNMSGEFGNSGREVVKFSANRVADPRFVDLDEHDLHLREGSPAKGGGLTRFAPPKTIDGRARRSPPGVGAY